MKLFSNQVNEKKILLGLTGSIAIYKSCDLIRLLQSYGCQVRVIMTKSARKLIKPTLFETLTGRKVLTDTFKTPLSHISLSRKADLILIAPATANIISKSANGVADDLLSTVVLARNCPLILAPAMNKEMLENPLTQKNMVTLKDAGVRLIDSEVGNLICGEYGNGKMAQVEKITEIVLSFFYEKNLSGKKVLLTSGGTVEKIDPVREISNSSSGLMGNSLARAFKDHGAEVTLITGRVTAPIPFEVDHIPVLTAEEMLKAVMEKIEGIDIFVSAAAVSDFKVKRTFDKKIKATDELNLNFERNVDILATVSSLRDRPFCVGFAAESEDLIERAEGKRRHKNIPLIVVNHHDAINSKENQVTLLGEGFIKSFDLEDKLSLAYRIVDEVVKMYGHGIIEADEAF